MAPHIKFLDSKWFERLYTSAIAIIILLLGQAILGFRENRSSVRAELKEKASIVYVNQQDNAIKESVDRVKVDMNNADKQLLENLNNNMVEINTNLREIRNYIYTGKKGNVQ